LADLDVEMETNNLEGARRFSGMWTLFGRAAAWSTCSRGITVEVLLIHRVLAHDCCFKSLTLTFFDNIVPAMVSDADDDMSPLQMVKNCVSWAGSPCRYASY
jgi:hypothetical protein